MFIHIETGFLEPIAIINRNRLNMHNRINHGQNNTLKTIFNRKEKDSWAMENKEYLQKLGIPAETMENKPAKFKAECRKAIQEEFRARREKGTEKSKMENKTGWEPGKKGKVHGQTHDKTSKHNIQGKSQNARSKSQLQKQISRQNMQNMPPRGGNPRSRTTTMRKERHTKSNRRGNLQGEHQHPENSCGKDTSNYESTNIR